MLFQAAALLAAAGLAVASPHNKPQSWETAYTATSTVDVAAAAATAKTSSRTSHVKGKAFDRIVIVYFENQNYEKAAGDPNFAYFAQKGITLTNYFGVTHPSQPNYKPNKARFLNQNVSTVIDLLEHKGISWAHYEEDMPYSGYEGYSYANQETGANDYMRKHNPAIIANSVTESQRRLSHVKNLSMIDTSRSEFHKDLNANKLPQWMFITPNMTSDGHDTSVTVAGEWCHSFLDPLLNNTNFMQNTMVLLTWDESETYTIRNNIFAILLGDAIPENLVGTVDDNFYNHYSEIATVEANWGLHTLGRWDVGANVYNWVAQKSGDRLRQWASNETFQSYYWNVSYNGVFNTQPGGNKQYPAPNLNLENTFSGRQVLPSIRKTWKHSKLEAYYQDTIEVADGLHPPANYAPNNTNET